MAISPRGVVRFTSFGSTVGFSGSADRMALFPFSPNPSSAAILENSNGDISAANHPNYSVFGSRMGVSGSIVSLHVMLFTQTSRSSSSSSEV